MVAAAGLVAAGALTLTPHAGGEPVGPSLCLVCGDYGLTDVVLNILLFIPFGVGLRLAGMRPMRALALAAAVSLAIELLQVDVVVGRDASLGDLVSNSVGGAIGIGLAARWRSWLFPGTRASRWCMRAGALIWLLILAGSSWAVQPSLSRLTYWGHWASTSGPGPLFDGRVIRAAVGPATLPWNPIANSRALRYRLLRGHQPLQAEVTPGAPIDGLAPITRITDITRTEMVMLGQQGRDLVYHMRTHAGELRLRDPALRIENAFPDAATVAAARAQRAALDTLRIAGAYTGQGYQVWMTRAGKTTSRALQLGPGLGWTLLIPFDYASGRTTRLLTALWLGGLFLPVAYWGARSTTAAPSRDLESGDNEDRSRTGVGVAVALLGATIAIGLGLTPLLLDQPAVHGSEWLACIVSAAIGWGVGRLGPAGESKYAQSERRTVLVADDGQG